MEQLKRNRPVLWNRNFIQCCVSYFLMNLSFYMLLPTMPLYLTEGLGMSAAQAGLILSCYTVGGDVRTPVFRLSGGLLFQKDAVPAGVYAVCRYVCRLPGSEYCGIDYAGTFFYREGLWD
ncbi:MAG: hypothetical protein LIO97_03590 [Tannerellaceae bacterium]|nr:hypothetical protein [Tannerellaceae bacterium]